MNQNIHPDTLLARGEVDPADDRDALIPPIQTSTTYRREADNSYPGGRVYTRADNPGYEPVEALLARLEGGADAMVFASGMAAATAVFQTLKPGDHIVASRVMYWSLRNWLIAFAEQWGLGLDLVDTDRPEAVQAALQPGKTRLLWVETPGNPLWTISDIETLATLAHDAGARLAVDSTVATPVLSQPLHLGADWVMHSATKYLNGHSDVLAGALVTRQDDEHWARLKRHRAQTGAVPGPIDAAQLLRGMRTLALRVERSCRNAQSLAESLQSHPAVTQVLYPGLPDHPGHAVAARQMQGGFGGMLSIRVRGGFESALAVAAGVRIWTRATSLGGVESLIEHRASIEGEGSPVPEDLLRLSVGIEAVEDLWADLNTSLNRIASE